MGTRPDETGNRLGRLGAERQTVEVVPFSGDRHASRRPRVPALARLPQYSETPRNRRRPSPFNASLLSHKVQGEFRCLILQGAQREPAVFKRFRPL